jgi:hypothetical protein
MTTATAIKLNAPAPAVTLNQLDLSECLVTPDLIAHFGHSVTLYRCEGPNVHVIGVFDDAADAFAALDVLDAP